MMIPCLVQAEKSQDDNRGEQDGTQLPLSEVFLKTICHFARDLRRNPRRHCQGDGECDEKPPDLQRCVDGHRHGQDLYQGSLGHFPTVRLLGG